MTQIYELVDSKLGRGLNSDCKDGDEIREAMTRNLELCCWQAFTVTH